MPASNNGKVDYLVLPYSEAIRIFSPSVFLGRDHAWPDPVSPEMKPAVYWYGTRFRCVSSNINCIRRSSTVQCTSSHAMPGPSIRPACDV